MATSLKIDDALKERVQQLANERKRSAHGLMLEAIEQYVEREEARETFTREALASWTAYKETGRHLTLDEVSDWLETWGTADENRCKGATSNRHGGSSDWLGAMPSLSSAKVGGGSSESSQGIQSTIQASGEPTGHR
jgi:predicted transcriptional regulator